jgi:hypothetical protein
MSSFTEPMSPAPMADIEIDGQRPQESAAVAESLVFAHQSLHGENTLNVEIDAPSGVVVRVHLNDDHLIEATVP